METCYGGGAIAASVIATFASTVVTMLLVHLVWKRRKSKQNPLRDLVLVESGGEKGYENSGFKEDACDKIGQSPRTQSPMSQLSPKSDMSILQGDKNGSSMNSSWKRFAFVPSQVKDVDGNTKACVTGPVQYIVNLKGHDFTGLGFSIDGSMKNGAYIKEVMQRGPAAESREMTSGDQIRSLRVSFEDILAEDAVSILGVASPYEVQLVLTRGKQGPQNGIDSETIIEKFQVNPDAAQSLINDKVGTIEKQKIDHVKAAPPDTLDTSKQKSEDIKFANVAMQVLRPPKTKISCTDIPDSILQHMEMHANNLPLEHFQIQHPVDYSKEKESIVILASAEIEVESIPEAPQRRHSSTRASEKLERKNIVDKKPHKEPHVTTVNAPQTTQTDDLPAQNSVDATKLPDTHLEVSKTGESTFKSKFHIRLFHKSKQYDLESESKHNELEANLGRVHSPSDIETSEAFVLLGENNVESNASPLVSHEKPTGNNLFAKSIQSLIDLKDRMSPPKVLHVSSEQNEYHDKNKHNSEETLQIEHSEVKKSKLTNSNDLVHDQEEPPCKKKRKSKRKAPTPPENAENNCTPSGKVPSQDVWPTPNFVTENMRSASINDLGSTEIKSIDEFDRAKSLDFQPINSADHLEGVKAVADLSHLSDEILKTPRHNSTSTDLSSSNSSSSETLRDDNPATYVVLINENITTADNTILKGKNGEELHVPKDDIDRVAKETVEEVIRRAEKCVSGRESDNNKIQDSQENIAQHALNEANEESPKLSTTLPAKNASEVSHVITPCEKKSLLRDDSKNRLMQTVADANDIKISQPSHSLAGNVLELSPKELDDVMMSHQAFLQSQSGARKGQDTSFDNWIYVDHQNQALPRKSEENEKL